MNGYRVIDIRNRMKKQLKYYSFLLTLSGREKRGFIAAAASFAGSFIMELLGKATVSSVRAGECHHLNEFIYFVKDSQRFNSIEYKFDGLQSEFEHFKGRLKLWANHTPWFRYATLCVA